MSVVLLYLLFDEPVSPLAVLGLVVILFSNLTLHARHRSTNALSLTLIATVYIALASQVLPRVPDRSTPEMMAATTGLFAILAGFILARVAERRTQELDARSELVRKIITSDHSPDHEEADRHLRELIELEFERSHEGKERRALDLVRSLSRGSQGDPERHGVQEAFDSWLTIHRDRLSVGEKTALWTTGLGSILFVMLLRDASLIGTAGSLVFAGGALLAIFTIGDYDRNNIHGFRNQVWRLQQGFREIGKPYYVPEEILDTGELTERHLGRGIRTASSQGEVRLVNSLPGSRTFSYFYLGTAVLIVVAVLAVPVTSMDSAVRGVAATSPRPGEQQAIGDAFSADTTPLITIGDPGWSGGSVVAEVLEQSLEEGAEVRVDIRSAPHDEIVAELTRTNGGIDIHPDLWLENQGPDLLSQISQDSLHLNENPYRGNQGVYVIDTPETAAKVRSLQDLREPENAALFDTDGDGTGEVWLGDRAWESTRLVRDLFPESSYPKLEGEEYSETIFKARLQDDAGGETPFLFYGYEPDWVHPAFSPRLLQSISDDGARERCLEATAAPSCSDSLVHIHVAHSSRVAEAAPEAADFLSEVAFTRGDVNAFIYEVEKGTPPEQVAADWVERHSTEIESWWEKSGSDGDGGS